MLKLTVRRDRIGPILNRHPWIFSGAFKHIPEGIKSGEPTIVYDEDDRFLAQGYFNSYSQIAVRLWSWDEKEEIDQKFFNNRIADAISLRQDFVLNKKTNACRLVNAENDLLPGLIVDKYGDYLCLQCHTPGIERWKKEIVSALVKILKPKGIYERSDVRERRGMSVSSSAIPRSGGVGVGETSARLAVRQPTPGLEAFPAQAGNSISLGMTSKDSSASPQNANTASNLLHGKVPERVKILENGFKFWVDIIHGQKTGFFLDQRDKREALLKYADGKNVLNCFSYTGGFSVYALAGGAKSVTSVDTSQPALDMAKENVKLNDFNVKKCEFVCEDVKQYLNHFNTSTLQQPNNLVIPSHAYRQAGVKREISTGKRSGDSSGGSLGMTGGKFDIIILDPPAFIKDRHKINEGLFGYKKINEMALRILPKDGLLVSASCSAHLDLPDFRFMLAQSAGRAGRTLQILETFTHGADHPSIVAFNEGEYLKCVFARVL